MKHSDSKASRLLLGNACILIATLFWGINVTVTKALIPNWMTANGITAVRLIGGCILMWTVSFFLRCDKIQTQDWKRIIPAGTIGLFFFIFLFVTSLKYGNPIDISIIMTLPPVFVIIMQIIFQKSRPSLLEYIGVLVSMAGAAVVIIKGAGDAHNGSDNLLGDCLAVASTMCYAFYLFILEKPSKTYKPVNLLRWVFLFAAIPALVLLIGFYKQPIFHGAPAVPWIEIAFILFCVTFLAYFLVQPAQKMIGAEMVSLYQYLLPVFATISAVLMKLDQLKWIQIAAMAVVVVGMVLTNIGKRRRVKSASN